MTSQGVMGRDGDLISDGLGRWTRAGLYYTALDTFKLCICRCTNDLCLLTVAHELLMLLVESNEKKKTSMFLILHHLKD